jgi:Domain of unknown function (DUF4376)
MQKKNGHSLVDQSGNVIRSWHGAAVPKKIRLPNGDDVHCATTGATLGEYRLVERWIDNTRPSRWHEEKSRSITFDGERVNVTVNYDLTDLSKRQLAMLADVNEHRDNAVNSGFTFSGNLYQSDRRSRENIAGAAQLASLAIAAGARPGDFKWDGSGENFGWIATDNSIVPMDAQTVVAFACGAAAFKKRCIMHGYELKQAIANARNHDELDAIDVTAGWPAL